MYGRVGIYLSEVSRGEHVQQELLRGSGTDNHLLRWTQSYAQDVVSMSQRHCRGLEQTAAVYV